MSMKYAIEAYELLDSPKINGRKISEKIKEKNDKAIIDVETIEGEKEETDFIKIRIPGKNNRKSNKTLGIVGRLGGLGIRPKTIGLVSDADGALAAITTALKMADMHKKGDKLEQDTIISTHICPNSSIQPHDPVDFMDSPVSIEVMNKKEVHEDMDAILSIDATKGNNIINNKGFAISPTVKEGYILKVSEDLLRIMENVTGKRPNTLPLSTQDITPYGTGLDHINSIMQPSTATDVPVVGIATTTKTAVPGCATGTNHVDIIESVSRYCIEVAKEYTKNNLQIYDKKEFNKLKNLYGSMTHLQEKN